jgi:hypothetical protein
MPSFGGEIKPSVPCRSFVAVKEPSNYVEFGLSGEIWSAISRPYFLLSLTEVSHAVCHGAPLEMNGGTKTGLKVQTASKAEVR